MVLAMSAGTLTAGAVYDAADSIVAPAHRPHRRASPRCRSRGAEQPAIRVTHRPGGGTRGRCRAGRRCARRSPRTTCRADRAGGRDGSSPPVIVSMTASPRPEVTAASWSGGRATPSSDIASDRPESSRCPRDRRQGGTVGWPPGGDAHRLPSRPDANVIEVADGIREVAPAARALAAGRRRGQHHPSTGRRPSAPACMTCSRPCWSRIAAGDRWWWPSSSAGSRRWWRPAGRCRCRCSARWRSCGWPGFSPEQPDVDGAHHLGRLRGRRRHRHDRGHGGAARPRACGRCRRRWQGRGRSASPWSPSPSR